MNFYHRIDDQLALALVQPYLAPELYELVKSNRDYLSQWMPWVEETKDVEPIQTWIKDSLVVLAEGTRLSCVILLDDAVVGVIGYIEIDRTLSKAKIGYWVSSEHQGKGVITNSEKVGAQIYDHAVYGMKAGERR